MKKLIFVILGIVSSIMVFSQEVRSRWTDTPLKIDGDNSDWIKNPKYWDSDSKVLYEARNDSENLYLIFAMTDKISQMKFMQAGFQIYIKVKSKPKLKASIDFLPQRIIRGKTSVDSIIHWGYNGLLRV